MSKNKDEVYAAAATEATDETTAADPETHDLAAVVAGDRTIRLRVRVQRPKPDLAERLQVLAEQIDSYPTDDDVPDEVVNEWLDAKDEFDAEDVYIVAGRNSEWLRNLAADLKEQGVITGDYVIQQGSIIVAPEKDQDPADPDYQAQLKKVTYHQLAAQTTRVGALGTEEPTSPEEFEGMYSTAAGEREADKIWREMRRANTQPVKALMPDFSQRVSRLSRRG